MPTLRFPALAALFAPLALLLSGCAGGNFGELVTGGPGGLCGLLIVILDIYAFVKIAQSSADGVTKLLSKG